MSEKRSFVLVTQGTGNGFDFIISGQQAFSLGDFMLGKILPYTYAMLVSEEMRKPTV